MAADQISIFCVDAGVSSSVKSVFFYNKFIFEWLSFC